VAPFDPRPDRARANAEGAQQSRHFSLRQLARCLGVARPAIGATVGIYVDPTVKFAGKVTGGVRLRPLLPPAPAAKPVPTSAPAQTAKPAAWPEQADDPGPDLDQADFGPAA
jgi:hypothetical protein